MVVVAVLLGQEDLAFRWRQRAFLTSTFGPTLVRRHGNGHNDQHNSHDNDPNNDKDEWQPPASPLPLLSKSASWSRRIRWHLLLGNKWSRPRQQPSSSSSTTTTITTALLQKLLKKRSEVTHENVMNIQPQQGQQEQLQQQPPPLPQQQPQQQPEKETTLWQTRTIPTTGQPQTIQYTTPDIVTNNDVSNKATKSKSNVHDTGIQRSHVVVEDKDSLDDDGALDMDYKNELAKMQSQHQPFVQSSTSSSLVEDMYQQSREVNKDKRMKSIMLRRNNTVNNSYHVNTYDLYERLLIQAALERATEAAKQEEEKQLGLGIRRMGDAERSRKALAKVVRPILLHNKHNNNNNNNNNTNTNDNNKNDTMNGLQRSLRNSRDNQQQPRQPWTPYRLATHTGQVYTSFVIENESFQYIYYKR